MLNRILLYVHDVDAVAGFYERHFGYRRFSTEGDRIVELRPEAGGALLMLHQASKGQKKGQSLVKLVFDVEDVRAFAASAAQSGLSFGPIHDAGSYLFANVRDPAGNPVSISSRAFAAGE